MLLLILFIAIVFTVTAFVIPLPFTSSSHSFISFLLYQLQVILSHSMVFTILSIIIVIALLRLISFEKKHPLHKKSLVTLVYLATVTVISVFASYLLLLSIAWTQLTLSAVLITTNPHILGIQTQKKRDYYNT